MSEQKKGFTVTGHKGFHLTFSNGYTVSVQWGPGNYADHHDSFDFDAPQRADFWASDVAEVAVMDPNGEFVHIAPHDQVRGWVTADQVAVLIAFVAAYQPAIELPFRAGVLALVGASDDDADDNASASDDN